MTDLTKSKFSRVVLGIVAAVVVIGAVAVYRATQDRGSNDMLEEVAATLTEHELHWAGRGRDYAQYGATLKGNPNVSVEALYRIPAATNRVPGVILLHTTGDSAEVFRMLNETGVASLCAVMCVDVGRYFERDETGKWKADSRSLGRGLIPAMQAVKLAVDFVRGHRIVDTTAVYLLGVGEANLAGLPAAAVFGDHFTGCGVIRPEAMFELRDFGEEDFGSPIYWAEKNEAKEVFLLSGDRSSEKVKQLAEALSSKSGEVTAPMGSDHEVFVHGVKAAIEWIMMDRPVPPETPTHVTPPAPGKRQSVKLSK